MHLLYDIMDNQIVKEYKSGLFCKRNYIYACLQILIILTTYQFEDASGCGC